MKLKYLVIMVLVFTCLNSGVVVAESDDLLPPCGYFGDLDSDGFVTSADRDLMLLHSVGDGDFTDEQKSRADLDGNGQSGDAVDVNLIVQFVGGDIRTFPACRAPPCASYGDLDDDGYVTYADRDLMLLFSVGDVDFTDEQKSRANLDGNEQSGDAVDVNLIVQFVAGDVSIFPVCTSRGILEDRTSGPSGPIVIPRPPGLDVAHEDGGAQCGVDEPCEQGGLECIMFPKVGLICAEPNPCSYYECPSGTSCMVAESYPAQVMCQCRGSDCSDDSDSTNTVAYDAQTRTVVVGVDGINVRQREVTISRTTSQNEGSGIVSKPKGVLKSGAFSAEYSGDLMFEESGLYMTTSAGKREINIMPEDVVGIPEMPAMGSVEIELREDSGRPAYFVKGANQGRLFFVLPVVIDVEAKVDAETGKLVSVDKPWWSFLAW